MERIELRNVIGLFKKIPAQEIKSQKKSAAECLRNGFVVLREGKPIGISGTVFDYCKMCWGAGRLEDINHTFHKAFGTVRKMNPWEYYLDQYLHYFSTYGAKTLGIEMETYIPEEEVVLPDPKYAADLWCVNVILAVDMEEIIRDINDFARNTVSFQIGQLSSFEQLVSYVTIPVKEIKSYEIKALYYHVTRTAPEHPVDFLRYLVYLTTGQVLLIKNKELYEDIATSYKRHSPMAADVFGTYDLKKLAQIFYRYKPIFLAYKRHQDCAPIINKIRRLAEKYHRPLDRVCIQNMVQIALDGDMENYRKLADKATTRELLKIYFSATMKLTQKDIAGVYSIRNGKMYVKVPMEEQAVLPEETYDRFKQIREDLFCRITEKMAIYRDKVFLIPEHIEYAVPWTEKQMLGVIPYGSKVRIPDRDSFVAGIHWYDINNYWIDLDLHLKSGSSHYGWDGDFRSGVDEEIIFTGDMVKAPQPFGASEAYYIEKGGETLLMSVYEFYSGKTTEIPFSFFMTTENKEEILEKQYVFDPDKAAFPPINLQLDPHMRSRKLGVFTQDAFVFYGGSLSNKLVPDGNYEYFIDGVVHQITSRLMLNDLLKAVGARVITDEKAIPEGMALEDVMDLRPERMTTGTLLNLVDATA